MLIFPAAVFSNSFHASQGRFFCQVLQLNYACMSTLTPKHNSHYQNMRYFPWGRLCLCPVCCTSWSFYVTGFARQFPLPVRMNPHSTKSPHQPPCLHIFRPRKRSQAVSTSRLSSGEFRPFLHFSLLCLHLGDALGVVTCHKRLAHAKGGCISR